MPGEHDPPTPPDDSGVFRLEPDRPAPGATPPHAGTVPRSVMEGIDEDAAAADIAVDPAPTRPRRLRRPEPPAAPREPLVDRDVLPMQVVLGAGILAAVLAAVFGFLHAPAAPFMTSLLLVYKTLLLTGAGFVALLLVAWFTRRPLGDAPMAGARLLLAVAAAHLLVAFHLDWPINLDGWLVAPLIYALVVLALFRFPREELAAFLALHFFLWLALLLGPALQSAVHNAAAPPG